MTNAPLIVVYGDAEYLVEIAGDLEDAGWTMQPAWKTPKDNWNFDPETVCWGVLEDPDQAVAALTAAARGAGIVALVSSLTDELAEHFVEDLRHIGPIEIREQGRDVQGVLSKDHQKLLNLLGSGLSIGQAADKLFISRRTAERRVAEIRSALNVKTTAEALLSSRPSRWPAAPQ